MTTIRTRLIRIGSSQGIRIPKVVLDTLNLGEEVEMTVEGNQLVIRPTQHPRAGWAAQFQAMAASEDNALLDDAKGLSDWDTEEWEWS